MGGGARPAYSRDRMTRLLSVLLALLLGGCSGYSGVRPDAGTTAGLNVRLGATASDLVVLGILAAAMYDSEADRRRSRLAPLGFDPVAPPLDETRSIHEQDCTRPLEETGANLRCR